MTGLKDELRRMIAADGPTRDLLCDDDLMRSHRLELPFGFDPVHAGT